MRDLWPRIEPLLAEAERPSRYLNHEFACERKNDSSFSYCKH